jgi:hypothetical protein
LHTGLLSQLKGKLKHHITNSLQFVQTLDSLKVQPEDIMVNFDVVSLFTKVPATDTLQLLGQHFEEDLLALFRDVLTSTYFCFKGQFYEQTDRVEMESPLSPAVANFFMEDFEKRAIEHATYKPTCWFRYVDDTFVIWKHGEEKLTEFPNHLNGCITTYSSRWIKKMVTFHSWTLIYTENQMAFLVTTNLYLHHNSHHHPSHKQSVLTSLKHRATAVCDQDSINQELEFRNNGYITQHICRAMKPPTNTTKMKDKPTSMDYIPFMQTTYGRLSRMLTEHNIKCIPLPPKKISN